MASDDLTIRGIIEFLLKGKGLEDAEKGAKGAGAEADKASKKMDKMAKSVNHVGKAIVGVFAAGAVARVVRSGVTEFAQYERGLNAIERQVSSFAKGQGSAVPVARAFLESLERQTGVLRQDALPSFQKFVGITKSVEGGMFAIKLAADLTNAGLGDIKTNSERLANLLQGEVTEAAKSLGLQLRNQNGTVKTQSELLQELIDLYGGFSEKQNDAQSQLERAASGWNDFKQAVGRGVAPALNFVGGILSNVTKVLQSLGPIAVKTFFQAAGAALGFAKQVAAALNMKRLIKEGPTAYAAAVAAAGAEGHARFREEIEGATAALEDIWEQAGFAAGEAFERGRDAAFDVAGGKDEERAAEAAKKRAAFEIAAETELQAAKAALLGEGTQARFDAEVGLLERQKEAALAKARELGAETRAIEELFLAERQGLVNDFVAAQIAAEDAKVQRLEEERDRELEINRQVIEARLEALQSGHALQLEQFKGTAEEKLQLMREQLEAEAALRQEMLELENEQALNDTELTNDQRLKIQLAFDKKMAAAQDDVSAKMVEIDKQEKAARQETMQQWGTAVLGVLSMVFGNNKAFAIAEALIQTYFGAAKAIAQNPPPSPVGVAAAAFVIAQGLARVQQITATNPTAQKGFDDPVHDRLARAGGRRWAQDLLRNIDAGFGEGLADMFQRLPRMASQRVTNINEDNSQTVNVGNVMGGRAGARQLARQLRKINYRENRTRDLGGAGAA